MNKLKQFIITGLSFFSTSSVALAQVSTDTELTVPVGGDILPGGTQTLPDDISASLIFSKLIPFAIKYTIRLAVALSVVALIIGGYQYMTAYGNTEKQEKARKTIIWAIVGLILAITAFGIVNIIANISFT